MGSVGHTSRAASWTLVCVCLIALLGIGILFTRRAKPIEQQIMAADRLEFVGEGFPLDGGSRAFSFYLPRKQYLTLLVVHRGPKAEGGNPDFQEIRVLGYRGTRAEIASGSPLENKLIALLRTAVINTNDGQRYSAPLKPERLLWIVERMQDRKSTW
jgi:hypothetical protein